MRLDLFLAKLECVKSRQKAKSLIEGGYVKINGTKITKPSFLVDESSNLTIEIDDPCPYVSRGGLKLEKILQECNISVENKIALDIGASTGGFTDCLLKHGAKLVYAVDSGSNQLDKSLKEDPRVISIENYNARNICYDDIKSYFDIITIDVSFISQTYILPSAIELLREDGAYMALIKPQFEVGKERVGKGGIVKKPIDRFAGVQSVLECAEKSNMYCIYFSVSPITGGDGNVEFLAVFLKNSKIKINDSIIKKIVLES